MPSIHVNDIDLWYEDRGTGTPLIFLHALSVDNTMWLPQISALSEAGYRVISVDLRGHGRSSAPAGPYAIPQMAADVYALVQQLDLGQVCVIGLSMGGRVALYLGLEYPDALLALVLVSTKSQPALEAKADLEELMLLSKQEGVYQAITRWYDRPNYRKLALAAPGIVQQLLNNWQEKSPDGFIGSARAILEMEPLDSRLSEIPVPTLAVAGELDGPCHPYIELYRRSISNCSVGFVPGAAHFVNVENAENFNQMLLEFLRKVQDKSISTENSAD